MSQSRTMIPLFRTGWVDAQEANDIRRLLDDNDICYYETPQGWSTNSYHTRCQASIWSSNPADARRARKLIEDYYRLIQNEAREQARRDRLQDGRGDGLGRRVLYLLALIGFLTLLAGPTCMSLYGF